MSLRDKLMSQESRGLRCELVTDFSRLQSFAPAWERLNQKSCGSAFQSWGWASAFWKTHGHELTLCTPVIFAGDTVVGIIPLAIRNGIARLLGEPYADYNGPLCLPSHAPDVLNAAFAALLEAPHPWTECVFNNLPESSPLVQSLESSNWRLRRHFQTVFQYTCPTVRDEGSGTFDRLARKESLRRHENRLRRQGNLVFRHIDNRREIQEHLEEFFAQHVTRQALNGVRSQFLDSAPRAMLRALVEELDPARELRFCVLELNGRAIAYHFGLQRADKFIFYGPSFDVNYWDDSPGEVVLRNLFKYAQSEKLSEFDFTIGDEAYKDRFANHTRQTWSVYFYRSLRSPRAQVLRSGRSLRDLARRNQRIKSTVRQAKQIVNRAAPWLRPATVFRSAAAAFEKLVSVRQEVVCRRLWAVKDATGTQVRRAGLRDLAQLKIRNAISQSALQSLRSRMRENVLYLVSTPAAEYLFWLLETGCAEPWEAATRIAFEAGTLAGDGLQGAAEALAALLCDIQNGGRLRLELPASMRVHDTLQRAGYGMLSRCFHISVFGRTLCRVPRFSMRVLKEEGCE